MIKLTLRDWIDAAIGGDEEAQLCFAFHAGMIAAVVGLFVVVSLL